jgi:hypothetical protein
MNILKIARSADTVVGLVFAALGLYWIATGSYLWGGVSVISAVVSFASAKYVPARWLVKRMMLARLR